MSGMLQSGEGWGMRERGREREKENNNVTRENFLMAKGNVSEQRVLNIRF